MRYRPLIAILLAAFVITCVIVFAPQRTASPSTAHVAATFFPLYNITRNIAPETIHVTQILPSGANPHTFEPSSTLVESLMDVDVIFAIGYGVDDWAAQLSTTPVRNVSDNIPLHTAREDDHAENLDDNHHEHESTDPHYWLTVPNAKHIATTIATTLSEHYPTEADAITDRLASYLAELDAADAQIREILAGMPNRNVITMHDAWYYFAEEYGFTIAGTFEPSAGREPTPQYLATLQETIARTNVHTLYIEPASDGSALDAFAADNDLTLLQLDAEGILSPASYIDLLLSNAQAFSQNY